MTQTVAPTYQPPYTPSQQELSAQAERVYRAFFNEWTRLKREGGADEPTEILLNNGAGPYLESVMKNLRDQKAGGHTIGGPLPVLKVVGVPGGDYEGIDPRLTLQVCEDSTAAWWEEAGERHPGGIAQGTVYLGKVDDRIKVMGISTELVKQCTLTGE